MRDVALLQAIVAVDGRVKAVFDDNSVLTVEPNGAAFTATVPNGDQFQQLSAYVTSRRARALALLPHPGATRPESSVQPEECARSLVTLIPPGPRRASGSRAGLAWCSRSGTRTSRSHSSATPSDRCASSPRQHAPLGSPCPPRSPAPRAHPLPSPPRAEALRFPSLLFSP